MALAMLRIREWLRTRELAEDNVSGEDVI